MQQGKVFLMYSLSDNSNTEDLRNSRKKKPSTKVQLDLLEGATSDDSTIVSLVAQAIKNTNGGFVLVDFPRNRNQAQLLERELTG